MSLITANPNLAFVNLEQFGRMMLLAFFCDIPIAVWGAPGIGKSSKVWQIAAKLNMRVYDLRLSDKEKSDIGGIPFPVTLAEVKPYIEYLIAKGLLPFDTDEHCILFCDEADRTDDPGVKNAIQQIWLDRACNGHILSPNCRIVIAGNGMSDIDTSPLSKAANGRMIHAYVENESQGALDSWLAWGEEETLVDSDDPETGVQTQASPLLMGFARFNHSVFINGQASEKAKLEEQAEPTNRTWIYADKIIRATERITDYRTSDILLPLVAGCIGLKAAREFLAYRKIFESAPTIEEILADPEKVRLPMDADKGDVRRDVLYTLTFSLTDQAKEADRSVAEAIATYGLRWPEEPAALLFRRLLEKQPLVATTDPYRQWLSRRIKRDVNSNTRPNYLPELAVIFPGSVPKPENDLWTNRLQIPSRSNPTGKGHILSQNIAIGFWACDCPRWINKRTCDHVKRVPESMKPPSTPATVEELNIGDLS